MQLGVCWRTSRGNKRYWDSRPQRTSTLFYINATHNRRDLLRSRTPSLMDVRTRISQDLLLHWTTTEGQRDEVEHRLKDNEGADTI